MSLARAAAFVSLDYRVGIAAGGALNPWRDDRLGMNRRHYSLPNDNPEEYEHLEQRLELCLPAGRKKQPVPRRVLGRVIRAVLQFAWSGGVFRGPVPSVLYESDVSFIRAGGRSHH